MAPFVKQKDFGSGHDLRAGEFQPRLELCADSSEPGACFGFCAKNPAGWQEAMSMVNSRVAQVVIGVNGQVPDGQDLSWLWDVDFSGLIRGRDCVPRVIACGERGADLAVRLEYANIHCELVDTPMEALKRVEPGRVEMLLNYTALRDFKTVLESREKNR